MRLDVTTVIMAGLVISLTPRTQAASCPDGTVTVNLTSISDVQALTDAMNCSGGGNFDVTFHGRLQIDQRVEVSEYKNVTVAGSRLSAAVSDISSDLYAVGSTNVTVGSTSDEYYGVIDARNTTGIFLVSDGSTLTINNLMLEGGHSDDGGAIAVTSESSLRVFGCAFTNNRARTGGAVSANRSEVYIDGASYFSNNSADFGGAIYAYDSRVVIDGSAEFANNSAAYSGGAIHSAGGSTLLCSAGESPTNFTSNAAAGDGGAISMVDPIGVDIDYAAFSSNTADRGGAVYMASPTCGGSERVYRNCSFSANHATNGGAMYLYGDVGLDVVGWSTFDDNYAVASGGAIYLAGRLKLVHSDLDSNKAGEEGVAIASVSASSMIEFADVTFTWNALYCPLGEYGGDEYIYGVPTFHIMCKGCSTEPDSTPDGVWFDEWRLPFCKELPTGAIGVESGTTVYTLTLEEGYYRVASWSADILECYRREACVGGNDVDEYCAEGYKGAYCATCSEGFSPGVEHSCRKCSAKDKIAGVAISAASVVVIFLAAAALLKHLGTVAEDGDSARGGGKTDAPRGIVQRKCSYFQELLMKALPLTAIKIVVVVWQIVFQFSAVAEDVYPEQYEVFLSYISFVNFDISVIVSYTCLLSPSFYGRLQLITLTPLVVLATLAAAFYVAKKRYTNCPGQLETVRRRHLCAGLFVVFFVYSSVCYTIFQTFICDELDVEDMFLQADYDLACWTRRHKMYMVYAGLMVMIYPIGIPAIFLWWLVRNRRDLNTPGRTTIPHLQPFSTIWGPYKPTRYYFEVVECCRRLTISMCSAFLVPNSVNQIAVVLSLAVAFLFVSESMSPFANSEDMSLYRWGNGVVLASMYVALLMKANESNEQESGAVSVFGGVLITANVVMVLAVLVEATLLARNFRMEKTTEPVEHDIELPHCSTPEFSESRGYAVYTAA